MFRQSAMFPPLISGTEVPPQPQPPPPVSSTESSRRQQMAASSPAKSQPLHNFPLSDLKWAMNHTNTHRLRKPSGKSPLRDTGNRVVEERNAGVSSSSFDSKQEKNMVTAAGGPDMAVDRSEKKSTAGDVRSKILIRIRPKGIDDAAAAASTAADIDEDVFVGDRGSDGGQEAEDFAPKTWNLRPRKPPPKKRPTGIGGGVLRRCSGSAQENKAQGTIRPESTRSRNNTDSKIAAERKEKKHKFSISLSKTEIDEDIFALTGSKPSRRPKKRAKNVQKQLDVIFPGLWMGNVTPDAYKVSDHP